METLVITWRELLIAVVLVLAVYIAEMLLLMRSGKDRGRKLWQRGAETNAHTREIRALEMDVAELSGKLEEMRKELEQLKTAQRVAATPYNHAIQMAQRGCDANELAASCGISRAEAELIVAMHRSDPS